ncbi:hypothetical protein FHX42_004995 [Saccharopolyspora lacisalsi]|uniref:Uncharacterized protein n=1 Tax=Halosaccharopolyspora lacisalsi TaxID=1000566 RepID=A0A839E410_9PSEU|nr:hypothetical protein [Halosaccharopolyspora lacisalsi]
MTGGVTLPTGTLSERVLAAAERTTAPDVVIAYSEDGRRGVVSGGTASRPPEHGSGCATRWVPRPRPSRSCCWPTWSSGESSTSTTTQPHTCGCPPESPAPPCSG